MVCLSCFVLALGIGSSINPTSRAAGGYAQKPFADDSPPANLIAIKFINRNTGWLAGRIGLFKTIDGGKTWFQIGPAIAVVPNASPFALGMLTPILGIDFVSEQTGWALRYDGLIKMIDGDQTWIVVDHPLRFYQFSFYDDRNGWALAHDLFIYHSSDGGKTWIKQIKGGPVKAVSPTECWALGDKDTILRTKDAGMNWLVSKVNTSERLFGPLRSIGKKGWVKTAREVYASEDDGLTWQSILRLSKNDPDLNSMGFADELNGWAVGDKGLIFHTMDGGKTWEKQNSRLKPDLGSIAVIDQSTVWVLSQEIILKTTDGGKTWIRQRVPEE